MGSGVVTISYSSLPSCTVSPTLTTDLKSTEVVTTLSPFVTPTVPGKRVQLICEKMRNPVLLGNRCKLKN